MENDPQKKQKYKIVITIIICLLIGMIPGYLLGANLNSNNTDIVNDTEEVEEEFEEVEEDTEEEEIKQEDNKQEENKQEENKQEENKQEDNKQEEKNEETKKDNIIENTQKKAVIDLSKTCINENERCIINYNLDNNQKSFKVTIKNNTEDLNERLKGLFIDNKELMLEDKIDSSFEKIAILDNNIIVIEIKNHGINGNIYTRYYLSDDLLTLYSNSIYDLIDGYFKEDITSKEITVTESPSRCVMRIWNKNTYRVTFNSKDDIVIKFIKSEKEEPFGQC